ncbi:MAG: ABC transporter ATP-binding protein [Bradyrhizobiaceae bacterium]|nr:ABC transporter ATP-binding protein [Bradyrhizobiaceae bacterium]
MKAQLEIQNLTKRFGGLIAVNNLSLSIQQQAIAGLIGPNGAGKTTVFNLITGFSSADSGGILLEGSDLSGRSPHNIAKAGIARTFQNIRLFPWMTVLENVIVACQIKCHGSFFQACLRTPFVRQEEKATKEKAEKLLRQFQLQEKLNYQAKNLSYGEQRKLEIARALATEPKILLLDEPTAGMNPAESNDCVELIFNLNETFGITILLIEHNMNVVMSISDKVFVLDHGVKIAEGPPEEIQNNSEVIKAYLGDHYVNHA